MAQKKDEVKTPKTEEPREQTPAEMKAELAALKAELAEVKADPRIAEFPDDAKIEAGMDYERPDRTKIPDSLKNGTDWCYRHVREDKVKMRKFEGWQVVDPAVFESNLPEMVLMRWPRAKAEARARWLEQQNAMQEASVKPQAQADRIAAESGAEAFVPAGVVKKMEAEVARG